MNDAQWALSGSDNSCANCGQPIRLRLFDVGNPRLGTIWLHDNGDLACTLRGELSEGVFARP